MSTLSKLAKPSMKIQGSTALIKYRFSMSRPTQSIDRQI